MKCRNDLMISKPRIVRIFGMEPGSYLFTAQVVSGMKGARAWLGRLINFLGAGQPLDSSYMLSFSLSGKITCAQYY